MTEEEENREVPNLSEISVQTSDQSINLEDTTQAQGENTAENVILENNLIQKLYAKEKSTQKNSDKFENTSPILSSSSRNSYNSAPASENFKKVANLSAENPVQKSKNTGILVICQHKTEDWSYDERELLSNTQSNYKIKSESFLKF